MSMGLWETAGTALAGGVGGGAITVLLQELRRRRNAPAVTLDWYSNQSSSPTVVSRTIDNEEAEYDESIDNQTRRLAKDIHLLLENCGRSPARECQVKAEIYESGSKNPQPVRLGTRIKPPILYEGLSKGEQIRERTAPFQVNRNDSILIDLFRLSYVEIAHEGASDKEVTDASLHTLASFRQIEFKPGTKYTIHVTATAANANPAQFGLALQWDGSIAEEEICNSLNEIDPDVVYF